MQLQHFEVEDILSVQGIKENIDYQWIYLEFCETGLLPSPLLHYVDESNGVVMPESYYDAFYEGLNFVLDVIVIQEMEEEIENLGDLSDREYFDLYEQFREVNFYYAEEVFIDLLFDVWTLEGYVLSESVRSNDLINEPFQPTW